MTNITLLSSHHDEAPMCGAEFGGNVGDGELFGVITVSASSEIERHSRFLIIQQWRPRRPPRIS